MATTKRETDPRTKRTTRNMSPVLKLTEPSQGLRRARSVPSSPDRKLSPAPAPSSSTASRPSSSFNARTTSPRPTSGSSSSSNHGKALHPPSSMATAKPASSMTMRGKADKAGGTTRWPRALATNSLSSKDMNKAAKTVSTLQKSSSLSPKPGVDKMMLPLSPKPKTQSAIPGALSGSRITQDGNKKTGAAKLAPILRTRSVPARSIHPPKTEEQEMELLMEFDEAESISTPSIEEHLQERLPDPVDLTHVDAIAYVASLDDRQPEPSSVQPEDKIDQFRELTPKEEHKAPDNGGLNGGEINTDDAGINNEVHQVNEAERELKEDVHEAELNKAVHKTELTEAVVEPVVVVKKEAEAKVEKVMPQAKVEKVMPQAKSNEVKEEGMSKPAGRKNKIMALIGKFETAMSS